MWQKIFALNFGFEKLALFDTKAVLFVHDKKTQFFELNVWLQNAVRGDDHLGAARGKVSFEFGACDGLAEAVLDRASGVGKDSDIKGLEQLTDGSRMLLGQNNRGRQEHGLLASARRLQQRQGGQH